MPNCFFSLSPITQATAAVMKISIAITRCSVHGMSSFSTSTRCDRLGFKTTNRENSISGNSASIIGRPNFSQPAKSKFKALAAMAFGGEPTTVPKPPILAQ